MIYLAGTLAILVFVVAFERFGVTRAAVRAVDTTRAVARLLREPTLDDNMKERVLRQASLSLAGGFFSIGIRGLGALAASVLPLLAFELIGLADFAAVVSWLAGWEVIILVSVGIALWYLLRPGR